MKDNFINTNEFLVALSDMMDSKFEAYLTPIYQRLDRLEKRMDYLEKFLNSRMDDLENRMDALEISLNNRMDALEISLNNRMDALEISLNDRMDALEISLNNRMDALEISLNNRMDALEISLNEIRITHIENNILPRLYTIESVYIETFNRYSDATPRIESIEIDVSVLKSVVKEHSKKLNQVS